MYQELYVSDLAEKKMLYRQSLDLNGFTHYNALAVAASLWNYYYAAFTALPLAITAARHGWRRLAGYVGAGLLAALLYLPWIPIALGRAVEWTSPWTPPTSPARVVAWTWPALLTGIPAIELWRDEPLVDLRLFARPAFSTSVGCIVLAMLALVGLELIAAQYLQLVLGLSPLETGLRLLPLTIAAMAAGLVGSHMLHRFGPRRMVSLGFCLTAFAVVLLTAMGRHDNAGLLLAGFILLGFGLAYIWVASVGSRQSWDRQARSLRQGTIAVALGTEDADMVVVKLDGEEGLGASVLVQKRSPGSDELAAVVEGVDPPDGIELSPLSFALLTDDNDVGGARPRVRELTHVVERNIGIDVVASWAQPCLELPS